MSCPIACPCLCHRGWGALHPRGGCPGRHGDFSGFRAGVPQVEDFVPEWRNTYDPDLKDEKRSVRAQCVARDLGRCRYCGVLTDPPVPFKAHQHARLQTIDHLVPKSQGGEWSVTNCVTACFACNNRKGDRTPEAADMPLIPLHRLRQIHDEALAMD